MFPENVELRRQWQFAWADVQMTMQPIEFYFSQVIENPEAAPVLPSFESDTEDDDWEPCDGRFTRLLDSKEDLDCLLEDGTIDRNALSSNDSDGSSSDECSVDSLQTAPKTKGKKRMGKRKVARKPKRPRRK